jgi:hypothetical protein
MTANDDTPRTGHESTDYEPGTFPLADESNEEVAAALRAAASETLAAADEAAAAATGEETLTDEQITRVQKAADAVKAVAETMVLRVPPEGQYPERRE